MTERIDGYSTKHALTEGIKRVQMTVLDETAIHGSGRNIEVLYGEGVEWHRTLRSAVRRAEEMRVAKIASLRKSIARLEELRFGEGE